MKRTLFLLLGILFLNEAPARTIGFGVDAFNRVVAASVTNAAAFSPLSFEIDSVLFAEAVDPIRRSIFSSTLGVMDEFSAEYSVLARKPFENPETNGLSVVWAHAFVVDNPRRIDPTYRLFVQGCYGAEICSIHRSRGIEAWIRTRFAGDFDGWRQPPLPKGDVYALQDLVSLTARVAPTNGWKRVCPTHTVYRQPLQGGTALFLLVPKSGRSVSSVRMRLTSVTLPEMLVQSSDIIDPPVPVWLALPEVDIMTTSDLAGAFSYFRFPTVALKLFPTSMKPASLRQTVRFRLKVPPAAAAAERLEGPFLFFIHDPAANAIPVMGIISEGNTEK